MISWHKLEDTFIETIIDIFDWPKNYLDTRKGHRLDDLCYKSINHTFTDYIKWNWDGVRIRLKSYEEKGSVFFLGPIYEQSLRMIPQIEKKLTEIYSKWAKPYLDHLIDKVMPEIYRLQSKSIPPTKLTLPQDWKLLVGEHFLGLLVEEGTSCLYSSSLYGKFASVDIGGLGI